MKPQITRVQADLQMQAADRFHKVPFQVPEGAESVGVRIFFDKETGVIDLGCEGPQGWRGWSGGARTEFAIALDQATPGYLPGPITAGEWSVVLGLHNLPGGHCEIAVEVTIPSEVSFPRKGAQPAKVENTRGSARKLPAPAGLTWFAGDFHNHTVHSDGQHSIEELAALGVEMGLDFLAVTDHNTVSHHPYLSEIGREYGITLIPGQEVTTHRGHANAFGDIGWIDFRNNPNQWIIDTHERGGILSLNHPIDRDCSWLEPLSEKPGAVELWHSSWYRDLYGDGILAWLSAQDRDVTLIGGNDFHRKSDAQRPGTPTTWVAATENTPEAILEAVKAGRTTITGSVEQQDGIIVPHLQDCPILIREDSETILVLRGRGLVLVDFLGDRRIIESDSQSFFCPRDAGPYVLLRPDRMIVALSA